MPEIQAWYRVAVTMGSGKIVEVFVENRDAAKMFACNVSSPTRRTVHEISGLYKQGNRIMRRTVYIPAGALIDAVEVSEWEPQLVYIHHDPGATP